jgi:hypothetical protein
VANAPQEQQSSHYDNDHDRQQGGDPNEKVFDGAPDDEQHRTSTYDRSKAWTTSEIDAVSPQPPNLWTSKEHPIDNSKHAEHD